MSGFGTDDQIFERIRIARSGIDLAYRWAGRGAQPGVQASIVEWRKKPLSWRRKYVLLWWLLGPDGTPPYKMSKPDSGYVVDATGFEHGPGSPRPRGRQLCSNCMSLYLHVEDWLEVGTAEDGETLLMPTGTFICDQVRGVIRPQDTCTQMWSPQRSAAFYRRYQDPEALEESRRKD